jgi:hypothetical protein
MHWRKSTYSATKGDCVELAEGGALVHVRNSIHPERGLVRLPADAVADFVAACAAGELDDLAHR